MKQTQSVFLTGYVTIKITGHHPELFFDLCARRGLVIWNIRKVDNTTCLGNIRLQDVYEVKKLRRSTVYKISFVKRGGLPFLSQRFLVRKPLVIGIILSFIFVFLLSNIVWDVQIKGVHPEIEKRIEGQLDSYGIHPGALKFTIGSPGKIQQKLLDDIPELLWVGVTEKGTTYHLEGVEKTIVEEQEEAGPRNIVAAKNGQIVDMFVSKGQPMVKVNNVVQKGELLVSGELGKKEQENKNNEKEEKESQPKELVSAEGEIIAKTWYESEVSVPLEVNYDVLTGENKKKYYLRFWDFLLPVWGFKNPDYKEVQVEAEQNYFNFIEWELPIAFVKQNIQEKNSYHKKRTKTEAIDAGIEQAKKDLQNELGEEADITFEKVLHESIGHGKVKLTLYFTVYEDIAKYQPISQGD